MNWYHFVSLAALLICLINCSLSLIRLIIKGETKDYARSQGSTNKGIRYSMTGAMSPKKKESAYLHLPTYTAGLLYHFGTFLSILLFVMSFFLIGYPDWLNWVFLGFLSLTGLNGIAILIKRMNNSALRKLSHPDDYISNLLVTAFQFATGLMVINYIPDAFYYLATSLLLLYIPAGKLMHMVFFFAARYHLGWFYGYRGVWR